jgi:hypothetical protein
MRLQSLMPRRSDEGRLPDRRGETGFGRRMIRRAFVWAVVALLVFTLVATLLLDSVASAAALGG